MFHHRDGCEEARSHFRSSIFAPQRNVLCFLAPDVAPASAQRTWHSPIIHMINRNPLIPGDQTAV